LKKQHIYVILSYSYTNEKNNYSLLVYKKEEKDGKVVSWDSFPLFPPETIIVQKSIFLAASTLFILPRLKEQILYDTPYPRQRKKGCSIRNNRDTCPKCPKCP
jgi:hypothetical protein